jgi:16S rRNA (adenine1518-N6/adenine1519-N6)-dimethyltransferase
MSSVVDLKARLDEMGIAPKKAFGQNFLVNEQVIKKITGEVCARTFTDLVEIGPGLGALTEPLLAAGLRPRLIELDRTLVDYWRGRGMDVLDQDAIRLDWNALNLRPASLLVSNLPYQISTHLVVDRCYGPLNLKYMVLMFQKEVALKLCAPPRTTEYGLLSIMAQTYFQIHKVADAAPKDFFPAPKVASRVLAFERRPDQGLSPRFLTFLKGAFAFRRKFLLKNLKAVVDKPRAERLPRIFADLGMSEKARAEELTVAQFAALFKKVYEHQDHQ